MKITEAGDGVRVWLTRGELERVGISAGDLTGESVEGSIFTAALIVRLRAEGYLDRAEDYSIEPRARDSGVELCISPEESGRREYCFRDQRELTDFCREMLWEDSEGELYGFRGRYLLRLDRGGSDSGPSDRVVCATIKEHGTLLSRAPVKRISEIMGLSQG